MFAGLCSDINSLKYSLLHLTGQPNCQKGRSAKVKNGIISETKFLGAISVDRYNKATMEQHALKNINNCLNTNIYSYLETSGGQSSNPYLNVVHFLNARAD
jgi:hypothetical protein